VRRPFLLRFHMIILTMRNAVAWGVHQDAVTHDSRIRVTCAPVTGNQNRYNFDRVHVSTVPACSKAISIFVCKNCCAKETKTGRGEEGRERERERERNIFAYLPYLYIFRFILSYHNI